MSSGLRKTAQRASSRSLGSFVEVNSSSGSDFEPVDLEDMESHSGGEGEMKHNSQPGDFHLPKRFLRVQRYKPQDTPVCAR
jgi:hypothetical protein